MHALLSTLRRCSWPLPATPLCVSATPLCVCPPPLCVCVRHPSVCPPPLCVCVHHPSVCVSTTPLCLHCFLRYVCQDTFVYHDKSATASPEIRAAMEKNKLQVNKHVLATTMEWYLSTHIDVGVLSVVTF